MEDPFNRFSNFPQGSSLCDAKGRNCIEENSARVFNCSLSCEGIFASVQWIGKDVDEDVKDGEAMKTEENDSKELNEYERRLAALERKMKSLHNDRDGKGEEVDAEKYKMLIAEYRKFKAQRVKHFRLNSKALLLPKD